jgi:hypothetical protein
MEKKVIMFGCLLRSMPRKEFLKLIPVNNSTYFHWKNGGHSPNKATKEKIKKLFPEYLIVF